MKKRLWIFVFLVALILFSIYTIAGTEKATGPAILSAIADPPKVYPNQTLKILIEVEDEYGIESAVAEFSHEQGNDIMDMMLIAADEKRETYQSIWIVHDTVIDKLYTTKVTLKNKKGQITTTYVEWEDPEVVTHTWNNFTDSGYCIFWNSSADCPSGLSLPYETYVPGVYEGTYPYLAVVNVSSDYPGCNRPLSLQGQCQQQPIYYGQRNHFHNLAGTTSGTTGEGRRHGTSSQVAATYYHSHNLSNIQTEIDQLAPSYRLIKLCCAP
ncbi:hypothetical protein KY326_02850 [Candidatus Woesearchaeota archaeon]|nr:hypothetical protein [Candidatus Woesearchaeota archaeon]